MDTHEHACIFATIRKSRGAVAARRWLATWQRQAAANRDSNSRDANEHAYILAIIGDTRVAAAVAWRAAEAAEAAVGV